MCVRKHDCEVGTHLCSSPEQNFNTTVENQYIELVGEFDKDIMPDFPKPPLSGVKVIIVGAGFAGLSAATECDRKGHSVTLFEKVVDNAETTRFGDTISFDPNGSRIFEKWASVIDAMNRVIRHTTWLDYYKWDGVYQTQQSFLEEKK